MGINVEMGINEKWELMGRNEKWKLMRKLVRDEKWERMRWEGKWDENKCRMNAWRNENAWIN